MIIIDFHPTTALIKVDNLHVHRKNLLDNITKIKRTKSPYFLVENLILPDNL